ncbi:MAG: hypothetical protein HKN22_08400, partial [Bacteroidia bacterium]|nr:hypothetical protein [Bacteroidia bacterium]
YFLFEMVQWNIRVGQDLLYFIITTLIAFISLSSLFIILPILSIGSKLCYFNLRELVDAKILHQKINDLAKQLKQI